jgi:acyl-CoA synthetase (AMP-forming)/AMP-acid ligase II
VLIELLRRASDQAPERAAVITPAGVITYAELLRRSEAIARGLAARSIDRFAILAEDPVEIITALAASTVVGAEACVYPRDLDQARFDGLRASLGHSVFVGGARPGPAADAISLDELAAASGEHPEPPASAPVMILTTGTTGDQKGVRHEWARLADAVRRPDARRGTRWLLSYNLNQFAGVQILLHVLVSGSTLVEPASRQARDAIAAIREHGVTHASGTPTFWRLLVGGLRGADATEIALEQLTLGGEATDDPLLERLRALFPAARISHVYAGTEFGSAVSVGDGRAGLPLSVLERDDDAPVQLRIVDGELHTRSRVGMLGYHGGGDDGAQWRPTGDLVEIRDDRIRFVGRLTEIINVGGAKVHPLPIEELAATVEGVSIAAAYGRPNPITGQIVALDVVAAPDADHALVEAGIRTACEALPRAGRPRRIRFVEALEIRGNKLIRDEAKVEA